MQVYNTKARKLILEYLASNSDNTVSAADIIKYLNISGVSVNNTTVYRLLNRLTAEKFLLKFTDEKTQKSLYRLISPDSDCESHLHIKCVSCGRLEHLECELMKDIESHLSAEHGFTLKCDGSILYGVCGSCKNKKKI